MHDPARIQFAFARLVGGSRLAAQVARMRARGVALLLFVAGCGPVIPPPMFPAPVLPALPPREEAPEAPPFNPCPGGDGVPGDYLDPCAPLFMLTPWLVEGFGPRLFPALCPRPWEPPMDCRHLPPRRP